MNDGFEGAIDRQIQVFIWMILISAWSCLFIRYNDERSYETYICSKDDIEKDLEKYKFLEKVRNYIILR